MSQSLLSLSFSHCLPLFSRFPKPHLPRARMHSLSPSLMSPHIVPSLPSSPSLCSYIGSAESMVHREREPFVRFSSKSVKAPCPCCDSPLSDSSHGISRCVHGRTAYPTGTHGKHNGAQLTGLHEVPHAVASRAEDTLRRHEAQGDRNICFGGCTYIA